MAQGFGDIATVIAQLKAQLNFLNPSGENDVGGTLRLGSTGAIISGGEDYTGTNSFQPIQADISLVAASGSDDVTDPSFLAGVMGNILGDALTGEGNYLAGVIGAYSITGARGTEYPAAAVMGVLMDGAVNLDAIVLAVVDGSDPGSETKARAAFGVYMNNTEATSGVDYGLDLYAPAVDFFTNPGQPFLVHVASIRGQEQGTINNAEGDSWVVSAPAAVPADASLTNGSFSFWIDEATDKLMVRVRYSDGTYASGEVALTPDE